MVGKMKYQSILDDIVGEYFPVGTPDEEGIVFSALDEQVMKFGSLQHDTIDWEGIISNSHRYLSESCKDYKVLQYLGYALLYKGFKSNLVDFLSLFSEFNKKFLFNAYPKPSTDNTINRFKGKFITLIFERLENAASNNTDVRFTAVENEQIDKLIEVLSLQLSEKLPSVESTLSRLRRFVKERSDFVENSQTKEVNKVVPDQTATDAPITASQVSAEKISLNIPDVNKFELTNARQLKQFYFQVADTTCELQPSSILGYVSRRFGLWHSITQLPEMNSQGITAMQSVPLDKVSDYRDLVVSSPSVELLNRIEKTVSREATRQIVIHTFSLQVTNMLSHRNTIQCLLFPYRVSTCDFNDKFHQVRFTTNVLNSPKLSNAIHKITIIICFNHFKRKRHITV